MKLTLEKHGGWSAPLTISRRRAPFVIDTDDLKPGAVQELSRLVAAVKAAPPSQGDHLQRAPEAMSYTITVEDSSQTAVFQSRILRCLLLSQRCSSGFRTDASSSRVCPRPGPTDARNGKSNTRIRDRRSSDPLTPPGAVRHPLGRRREHLFAPTAAGRVGVVRALSIFTCHRPHCVYWGWDGVKVIEARSLSPLNRRTGEQSDRRGRQQGTRNADGCDDRQTEDEQPHR